MKDLYFIIPLCILGLLMLSCQTLKEKGADGTEYQVKKFMNMTVSKQPVPSVIQETRKEIKAPIKYINWISAIAGVIGVVLAVATTGLQSIGVQIAKWAGIAYSISLLILILLGFMMQWWVWVLIAVLGIVAIIAYKMCDGKGLDHLMKKLGKGLGIVRS